MADLKDFSRMKWYYQIVIVGGICGGLLALVWYQFLVPLNEEIVAREAQVVKLQGEVAKALQQQQIFAQFKKESAALQATLDQLKRVLPMEKETDELLRTIQGAVATSGMTLLNFRPRAQMDKEVYLEFPIDMEIVGTYHDVGAYLQRIRQLPRIVNISGLRVTSRASTGDAASRASVGATYVATTFIYKEEPIESTAPPAKAVKD